MANNQQHPPQRNTSSVGYGSILLYVTLFSVGALVLYKYFTKSGNDYISSPTEMQVNYVPSDFEFDIDDENTLGILSNPRRYRREFNNLVYSFNMSLLHHVANRMDLPDSLKVNLEPEYQKHHEYLKELYYNDFVGLKDTTSNVYQEWYDNESTNAIGMMNEVASKYTCFLVNHVIMTLVKTEDGMLTVKGRKVDTPCAIAMNEALRPMLKRLEESAAILDFGRSKGMLQEKVEKAIAELATMEVKDKKGLNKQLQTKVWGYAVSSTEMEVSAMSILKVGFKLDDYFKIDMNSRNKQVIVTLPEPTILSHEVYPKIDKLDIGWMRELKDVDLNKNFNVLRGEFRKDAISSDVFEKSKDKATEIMSMMLGPLISGMHKGYSLKIKFKNLGYNPDQMALEGVEKTPVREEMNIGGKLEPYD